MSTPVSLLIPCHNNARFLPALFATIKAQEPFSFAEIILFDDASSDDSARVAESLGARVIRSEINRGPAGARNALAEEASCDWIHFHDADDLLDPKFMEIMSAYAVEPYDVVVCDADWIEENGQFTIQWRYSQGEYDADPSGYFLSHPLGINNCLYRRSLFQKSGGFDATAVPWEDADFHIRLGRDGARFHLEPQVLTRSVRHPGGISMNYIRNWKARLACLQRYAVTFPEELHSILASEAEKAACALAGLGQEEAARHAISLCLSLGGNPPSTSSLLPGILKLFIPRLCLLRWKYRRNDPAWRDHVDSSST